MNWKEFELLVAAVHQAQSEGAEVKWNDCIEGRQFDVSVRFKKGLHEYLTVVECKNYQNPVPIGDVEAFVTKSRGVRANKAVMASSSGYQSGAIRVAAENNIILLNVEEEYAEPESSENGKLMPTLNIADVEIKFENGKVLNLGDGSKLHYLTKHTLIAGKWEKKSINQFIDEWSAKHVKSDMLAQNVTITLPKESAFEGDFSCSSPPIELNFKVQIVPAYVSKGPALDFQLQQRLAKKYVMRDMDGNLIAEHFFSKLALGTWIPIEPGRFYVQPAFEHYFYCESIKGDIVSWILVESYQHGILFQANFTQEIRYAGHYLLVDDKNKIAELQIRLEKLMEKN